MLAIRAPAVPVLDALLARPVVAIDRERALIQAGDHVLVRLLERVHPNRTDLAEVVPHAHRGLVRYGVWMISHSSNSGS